MAYVEYEADGKTVKARVKQKTDTLANWEANALPLLEGEQAFVVDSGGAPINFKIGDGTKRFSELPWWIQYDGGQYIQIAGNVLPEPTVDVGYSLVGPGTYTFAGQPDIVAPEGRLSQMVWDGSSWSLVDMGELPSLTQDEMDRINQSTAVSRNQADKSKIIPLSYYTTTGAISAHATYRRLPLIAVLPNTEYTVHGAYAGFIGCEFGNAQQFRKVIKSPVSGQPVEEYTFTTGADTYFVGLNVAYGEDAAQYDDTIMFNVGKKMPYEAFGYIPDMSKINVAYKDDLQPLDMIVNDFYDKYFIFNGTAKVPVGQDVTIGADGDYIEINARINGGTGSANWLGLLGVNGTAANTFGFYNKTSIWLRGQTAVEDYVRFDNVVPTNDDFTKFHKIRLDVVGTNFILSIDDEVVGTQAKISDLTINTIGDAYNSATVFSNVDIKYVKLHNSGIDLTFDNLSSMLGAVNVSEGIAPKNQGIAPGGIAEADPIMEVKKTADTFEIYMKKNDNSFLKQIFKRYVRPYVLGEISYYDVWKLGGLFRATKNSDFDYIEGVEYVIEGTEWETAIQVDGDHISGTQHGYEQKTSVIFLVDGVLITEGMVGNFKCRKIEVIEKSQLYRFDTTTNPIIDKTTKWTIERGKITIEFPEFRFLEDVDITYRCYLGMSGINRNILKTAFNDVSYYVNDLDSISTNPNLSVGIQNTNPNTNRIWVQSDDFGLEMNIINVDEVKDTRQMIVHNTTNKLYHIYCGIYTASAGENFSAKVEYIIS